MEIGKVMGQQLFGKSILVKVKRVYFKDEILN